MSTALPRQHWSILDNLLEGCQIIGRDWRYLYVNEAAAKHGRVAREYLAGKTMMEAFPGIQDTDLFTLLDRCMREGVVEKTENEFVYPDGSRGWFELSIEPVPEGLFILSQEITDRVRSHQTEETLRRAIANSHDAVFMTDREGVITYVNPAFEKLYGYPASEAVGRTPRILRSDKNPPELYGKLWDTVLNGETFRSEIMNKTSDGRYIDVETVVDPIYDHQRRLSGFIAIQRDVTERRRADDELRESQERFSIIFRRNPAWATLTHLGSGIVLEVNEAWEKLVGFTRDEAIGRTVIELGVYDGPTWDRIAREIREKRRMLNQEIGARTKRGDVRTLLVSREIVEMHADEYLLSMGVDITERKRAEVERAELLTRLQEITASIPGVIFQYRLRGDGSSHFPYASSGIRSIFGITPEDLREKADPAFELVHPDDVGRVRASIGRSAETLRPWHESFRVNLAGGKIIWAEGVATPRRLDDGSVLWHGYIHDTTEIKTLQEQYLRAQRMESIGTLAGGIAHDLNNILAPTMLALEILRRKSTDLNEENMLTMLQTHTQRGADLVKQVLAFARGTDVQRTPLQVRHLLDELRNFARNTFPANIAVEMTVPKQLWTILGDPTQIHQVLLNLCVNARDAMPGGGTLSLSAENLLLADDASAPGADARPGPAVAVRVKDTGTGMTPEVQRRIFEPFFTTKEAGKGTGLGLSTVYTIVREHGGFVKVYSEQGKGSEFKVFLPALESPETRVVEKTEGARPAGNGELILIVDDEDAILEIAKISLETHGYRVVTAREGIEAIGVYADRGHELGLVITDMNMPHMDGPALIRALRDRNPLLPIIGATGFADKAKISEAEALGLDAFLSKPFTTGRLLRTIADVLGSKARG